MLFIGIDVGTFGIRAIVGDSEGKVFVSVNEIIPLDLLYKG